MDTTPNVVLRGGPADGQTTHHAALGHPMSFEDVGGGSITYVATDEVEEREGLALQVYVPRT